MTILNRRTVALGGSVTEYLNPADGSVDDFVKKLVPEKRKLRNFVKVPEKTNQIFCGMKFPFRY